jgi:MFS transporter, DHA1 family, multidrug resistance protein
VPVLPLYAQSFGVPQTAIGLAIAVYGLGRLLFDLPMGGLTDRFGRKSVLLAGTIITAVGSVLCGVAGDFTQLIVFRFIGGIGAATVLTGAQVMLADISTRENRGRVMSIYQGCFLFAVGFGPTPGGFIADALGYRAPFYVFAVLGLVAGLIALVRLPETKASHGQATVGGEAIAAPSTSSTARQLFASSGFVLVCLVSFVQFFARTGAVFSVVPVAMSNGLGLTPSQIGVGLTIGNLLNFAVIWISGPLVDRYGRKAVIFPSTVISGLAFIAFASADSYSMFILGSLLWGVGGGIGGAAPAAYAADLAPKGANGITMGIYRTVADAGYVVGPTALGIITDQIGAGTALLVTTALFLIAAVLFGVFAPETGKRLAAAKTTT